MNAARLVALGYWTSLSLELARPDGKIHAAGTVGLVAIGVLMVSGLFLGRTKQRENQ
jgi:hypothetical protein